MSAAGCIVFAGGGTGGHIYPALAIAEHVNRPVPTPVHVICSPRPIDAEILTAARVAFTPIEAEPFGLSPAFVRSWRPAVRAAKRVLEQLRAEHGSVELVAMGGFVSPPAARAARALGVPITLVNLDAVPGRANRLVSKWSTRVVTACETDGLGNSVETVGPIVRGAALAPGPKAHCRLALGLDPERPVLFVTGASQGAATINEMLAEFVRTRPGVLAGWQVLHQVGPGKAAGEAGTAALESAYRDAGVLATIVGLLDEVGVAWGAAELAVSRAGAGSAAEVRANAVPTLFLPYPFHRDQHQRRNVEPMVEAGGSALATDHREASANAADAGGTLAGLLADRDGRDAMAEALRALGPVDGASRIASILGDSSG